MSISKASDLQCQKLPTDTKELALSYVKTLLMLTERGWAGCHRWESLTSDRFALVPQLHTSHAPGQKLLTSEKSGLDVLCAEQSLCVKNKITCKERHSLAQHFHPGSRCYVYSISPHLCLQPVWREGEQSRPAPAQGWGRGIQSC